MLILILGDCHAHLDLVYQACLEAKNSHGIEAAIQVGDFGFFPKVLHRFFQEGPRRFPVPLHVIDGNHEDHKWLYNCHINNSMRAWADGNLHYHARGSVATIGGMEIGFIGGALHADRRQEWADQWMPTTKNNTLETNRRFPRDPSWANWVTKGDVERTLALFNERHPELIVSHSCPAGIGIGMTGDLSLVESAHRFIVRAGHSGGPFHDCGEGGLSRIWHRLSHRPRLWIYGHFHRMYDCTIENTRFVCVGTSDTNDGINQRKPIIYDIKKNLLYLNYK